MSLDDLSHLFLGSYVAPGHFEARCHCGWRSKRATTRRVAAAKYAAHRGAARRVRRARERNAATEALDELNLGPATLAWANGKL